MNLINDPWIPVVFEDASSATVGIKDLYTDAELIRDLTLSPTKRVAVTRLLLCISQAALDGPENEEHWSECLPQIIPKSLEYLSSHIDKFELFDDRNPFLQIAALKKKDNATLDNLDFGLASGNNPTVFDHGANPEGRLHSPAWSALNLLSYQCFSPGGTIGYTTWGNVKTKRYSSHAPCLENSVLHTIVRGKNLLQTIHANLVTKEQVDSLSGKGWGTPVWENKFEQRDSESSSLLARTYLGRLVPLSRGIKIEPEKQNITLVDGIGYPRFPQVRDPMMTVIAGKEGLRYLNIDLSKHPWRELAAILILHKFGDKGGPLALSHLAKADSNNFDIWVGGLVADRGKIIDTAEWNFNLPVALMGGMVLKKYEEGINLSNQGKQKLGKAIRTYYTKLGVNDKNFINGMIAQGRTTYWFELNSHYQVLVNLSCSETESLDEWTKVLNRSLGKAYDVKCSRRTTRQMQAYVLGKKYMYILRDR